MIAGTMARAGVLAAMAGGCWLGCAVCAGAQDPPPKIPFVAVDVQGSLPRFPQTELLAVSRGLTLAELPGRGLGAQVGLHLHLLKWKVLTLGIGGQAMVSRSSQTPPEEAGSQLRPVTEKFRTLGSQLSLNFGNGNGWSYLSGGIGRSVWSIVPEGRSPLAGDEEALKTINYGGGARWFMKSHLAFSFDVRFYAINPGVSSLPGRPGSPRTTFLSIGAGVSLKP